MHFFFGQASQASQARPEDFVKFEIFQQAQGTLTYKKYAYFLWLGLIKPAVSVLVKTID